MKARGWLLLISVCLAFASLFMGWIDIRFFIWIINSWTGIAIGAAFLIIFWLYPLYAAASRKRMNNKVFNVIVILAIVVPISLAVLINNGRGVESGGGLLVFFCASLLLVLWMVLHQRHYGPCSKAVLQKLARGRCYWTEDDNTQVVYVRVFHAIGCAKFSLSPKIEILENHGLRPWALSEAEFILRRFEVEMLGKFRKGLVENGAESVKAKGGKVNIIRNILGKMFSIII